MFNRTVATFSIVAYDPHSGDLGVAVASKFLAVGSVVPWARAGAGAVATQARANIAYGPDGLALLERGRSAQEALDQLLASDELREQCQIGIVDTHGGAAAHTGVECMDWAGHVVGAGFAAQGNILAGAAVVQALAGAFTQAGGELAERLLAALAAGDAAGGDKRLLKLHRFYLTPPHAEELLPIEAPIVRELQELLGRAGYYDGPVSGVYDAATRAALAQYGGVENLEERLISETHIDVQVLTYMREKIGAA